MPLKHNPDRPRFDAREKVLGKALFAADRPATGLLHAMTVPAAIAKGDIDAIDIDAACAVPGVVRVFTWRDFADITETGATKGGRGPRPGYQPMKRPSVRHRGEPVALVVAETLEAAIEGAEAVRPTYREAAFTAWHDQPGAEREPVEIGEETGDAQAAFDAAAHKIDVRYLHPTQHHNAMEMISTTASFVDGKIIVMEGTQDAGTFKTGLAGMLGIDPDSIEGSSPYLGGGFGQKNGLQEQSALVVKAAMLLRRPVKLVMPRAQLFHTAHHRPYSSHRVRIAASPEGKLEAVLYDTEQQNSRYDGYGGEHGENVSRMYATPNWRSTSRIIRVDTQAVAHQRAPHEHPSSYATECAYDELAYKLGMDPVALRLANDAKRDPIDGRPFSSRRVNECLRRGAELFDWARRNAAPRSMRAGKGELVGLGVATGAYHTRSRPTVARLRLSADGRARIAIGGHEMGQGMRSVVAAEIINVLQIDPERLTVELGDTSVAPQSLTAGSWGCASAAPAARAVALEMRGQLAALAGVESIEGPAHHTLARVRRPFLDVELSAEEGAQHGPGGLDTPTSAWSWIAHFTEVRLVPTTGRVRVHKVVSVADCGRVMNHRTAASQVHGGVTWGIGAALREVGEVDPRFGRVLNNDLADYLLPVNADIGDIEVELLDQPDPALNISGVKGVGEVAMVGATASVVNAVHHASGRRVRHLPIRVEDLI
ncbi:xanthine dehydrogenase family protein molybdopterin-binding subunit [Aurantiacibacter flavus]|uniref:Xanthine dehydrogenase family protein molybdopterin-binding subunit n=1 Tax=Aurantiacibacter flavus TaxID=3145232 RepID=A0ABV0D2C0_9SPHN